MYFCDLKSIPYVSRNLCFKQAIPMAFKIILDLDSN